jgi:hypothetical protein
MPEVVEALRDEFYPLAVPLETRSVRDSHELPKRTTGKVASYLLS